MKIRITNEINLGHEMEVVDQSYPVQVNEKNGQTYLIYQNEEKEKVIIKLDHEQMTMTRFSNPKSIMRFHKELDALVNIPTPLGIQQLLTKTNFYQFDAEARKLRIDYELLQAESRAVFASYSLVLAWG